MEIKDTLEYRYLKLSDDLLEVGKLIYNADPYIYPALFGNEETASIILAEAIKRKLYCFCTENIFCTFDKSKPVAVLCKKQIGKYKWDYTEWKNLFIEKKVDVSESFEHVAKNHFMPMNETKIEDKICIFAVCVSSKLRKNGIGRKMIQNFLELHGSEQIVLDVLKNNEAAISLYKSVGFVQEGYYTGYNVKEPRPECIHMVRNS